MSDDNCLDAASPDGPVKLVRCHGMGGNQAWSFSEEVIFMFENKFVIFISNFVVGLGSGKRIFRLSGCCNVSFAVVVLVAAAMLVVVIAVVLDVPVAVVVLDVVVVVLDVAVIVLDVAVSFCCRCWFRHFATNGM